MPTRALVVDDEPDLELLIRQRFRKKIKDGEYEFVFARNGQEALDKLKTDPTLKIVLTDINMPVMDGLTLLSKLDSVSRPIKTVMVSAYGDMQNIRAAMNRGAYDFITKPIDFEDFELTLGKASREQRIAGEIAAGQAELESFPFDLRDVISRAIELVEVRVAVKGLYLRQSVAPDVPLHLIGDPERLRQILINLLSNSVKFTERGGIELRVSADPESPAPGRLRFEIADTGIGIPPDDGDRLFEPPTTRKYEDAGTGLAASKQLVELMAGRVWVESEPGTGSTFFFTGQFGVQENPFERVMELTLPPVPGDFESLVAGLRILLVDSAEGNRLRILSYLRNARCTIDVLEDSTDAVALFDPGRYDLVLIDIEMQANDGYAAMGEIRRIEDAGGFVPTPILAMTAQAGAGIAEHAPSTGFTARLTKPIHRSALLEALARHAPRPRRTNWWPKP